MHLLLIRHAQTHSNVAGALDTAHPGADLTELGDKQAEELAQTLADERIDAIWCSPRLRTRRTAAGLAADHGLEPLLRDGLVEIDAGDLEMSSDDESVRTYRDTVAGWIGGDLESRMPGGESGTEALARFDAVVEEILASGHERAAIVAHGAILRMWSALRAGNVGLDLARERGLGNTGTIRLVGDADEWAASEWDSEAIESAGPTATP
ncbi:MAG: histidine phosphatase [Nocardioidaceae bacterium]|nr:histidine phosphatase [Nocardioidaceae bacterium]